MALGHRSDFNWGSYLLRAGRDSLNRHFSPKIDANYKSRRQSKIITSVHRLTLVYTYMYSLSTSWLLSNANQNLTPREFFFIAKLRNEKIEKYRRINNKQTVGFEKYEG